MAIKEETLLSYLTVPEDTAVLEEQFIERSEEVLKLKLYLAQKGLLHEYELKHKNSSNTKVKH